MPEPKWTWKIWNQRRNILTLMSFLGYFNIYSLRVNMSIAIVAMTQDRFSTLQNGTRVNIGPEFNWDNKIQGYLLSSFFYGYIVTQLIGGLLARRFGGRLIFGGGIAATAFITLVSPWLAKIDVYVLLASRILAGLFEGMTFSSMYCLWAAWVPPKERTRRTAQTIAGSYTGTVFAMLFYGYLAEVAGWRSIFWFSGGLGLLWFAVWLLLVSDKPQNDSRISEDELYYIEQSLKSTKGPTQRTVPWKAILTSGPAWALNLAWVCDNWGFYTFLTLLPKYFKDVYQFDISKSGILSALPYLFLAMMMSFTGQIADWIRIKKWLGITAIRKISMLLGFSFQTCFLLGVAFWGNVSGTVFCLVMAIGMGAFAISTQSVNALDIAPMNSMIVFAIANTMGTLPGIMSPIIAGYIISTENPTVEQWRIVFYITAAFYFFGAVYYVLFSSGERQSWDKNEKSEDFSVKEAKQSL